MKWTIDRDARLARASLGGITREARYYGDQGCIIQNPQKPGHPLHADSCADDAARRPTRNRGRWAIAQRHLTASAGVDRAKLDAAADAAFADPAAMTAAFLVVHKGRIVVERYAPGITRDTQLESWSMGKSLAATLFALLVKDGTYTLEQPAPVPLWREPGDPRGAIRNIDLLRMSAGLRFLGNQEPGSTETLSGSLLHLHRRHRRVRILDHAAAGVSAEHGRPLPQQRSADHRVSDQAGRHRSAARTS